MDLETYETYDLSEEQVGYNKNFLVEGMEVIVALYESELLGINLPDKVELVVTETAPAVKGNTVTGATKDAIVETGLLVKVPLFIEEGEKIIISTIDGKYSSRA
jgi:elongation factor P